MSFIGVRGRPIVVMLPLPAAAIAVVNVEVVLSLVVQRTAEREDGRVADDVDSSAHHLLAGSVDDALHDGGLCAGREVVVRPEAAADRRSAPDVQPQPRAVIVHQRAGYDPTVEASVYIDRDYHRRGLGRTILQELIERARQAGYHSVIGGASADQMASIALQQSLGFVQVGLLKEVGIKFGRRLDVMYLQLML